MASSRVLTFTIGTLIAASAAGYYFYQKRAAAAEKPASYNTAVIAKGSIRQVVTATGQLAPLLEVDVGSQISGLVIKLHADFNSLVKKDQILVEIDPATYQQRLRQAKADLASTQASNRLQQLNTERTRELFEKKLVTQQELDAAEAQLAQSNAQLLTREAAVENANVDLARCTIRSPIDGIVIAKQTEEGKTVAASLNAPVLFTIANDLAKMQITAAVAEADIGSVRDGQAVTFTVDAFPNRSFNGRVSQVRNAAKTVSNVVTYDTIIDVDNR
ncbi:MAG: HlyD family secretion protein, partial [Verrucomicrobiota bacterium]|nr:HlyD family secretion protein [Verrucomicrobiota bacterium]